MKYVFSLGGSLIIPDQIDFKYIHKFVKFIKNLSKKNKIVVVCGGGAVARKYINALIKQKVSKDLLSMAGIESTRLNATLISGMLKSLDPIPESLSEVKTALKTKNLVVTGALGSRSNMTTDGNAADIAVAIKAKYFINLTDVDGLYDKNPKQYKNALLIPFITFKEFNKIISKIKFKAGQHFVLDQSASKIILENDVDTAILNGKNIKNIKNFFSGKHFVGTIISK